MNQENSLYSQDSQDRLSRAYVSEKPRLMARIRAAGKTMEETEDLIHDVYTETWGRLNRFTDIINLPAWLNTLVTRRLIDAWRHDKIQKRVGETDISEETLREVIAEVGIDPLEAFVRHCMVDALNEAIKSLPPLQQKLIEAQLFGGRTFSQLAKTTGESINTLKARKRSALKNLSRALQYWITD